VNTPYNDSLQATGGIEPYTWTITNGILPVGLAFASNGNISGTPAASGTSSFTAQVTDSTTPTPETQSVDLSITIDPETSNNLKLNGDYAFLASGFDSSGLFLAAGSFLANGQGNITGGVMDTNDPAGPQTSLSFTGTYAIGSNNLGTLCFNPSGNNCAYRFALAMSADGNARIIEFDDTTGSGTRDSGVLLKQDTSAFPAFSNGTISGNNYAFGFLGEDAKSNRYGVAGQFVVGGLVNGVGTITGGQLDSDNASSGTLTSTITGGSYSMSLQYGSTNGKGALSLTTSSGTTNYSFYVVSASNLLMMETDSVAAGNPLVAGQVLQQSGNGNSFSNGSLVLTSVVETTAECNGKSAQAMAGLLNSDGNGTVGLSADQNCGGALTQPSGSQTNDYSVASNGRAQVSIPVGNNTTFAPVLYLVASNEAFLIGTDSGVSFGFLQGQSGSFSDASLSGTYAGGSLAPVDPAVDNQAGIALVGSSNTLTLTTDTSDTQGLHYAQTSGIGYTVSSDGRVQLTENGSPVEVLYLISPSQYVGISTDANARVDAYQQ